MKTTRMAYLVTMTKTVLMMTTSGVDIGDDEYTVDNGDDNNAVNDAEDENVVNYHDDEN